MIFKLLMLLCAVSTLLVVAGQTTPVKLLVLVPWPSDREDAGWDAGLDLLAGSRVAVNEINNRTDLLKDYHIELVVPEYGHEPCGFVEASQGIKNLIQSSIHPPEQVLGSVRTILLHQYKGDIITCRSRFSSTYPTISC